MIVLADGTILDPIGPRPLCLAQSATDYAAKKGLKEVRVFLAAHPEQRQEFLIVNGETPEFASTSFEAICCHLDMMAFAMKTKP